MIINYFTFMVVSEVYSGMHLTWRSRQKIMCTVILNPSSPVASFCNLTVSSNIFPCNFSFFLSFFLNFSFFMHLYLLKWLWDISTEKCVPDFCMQICIQNCCGQISRDCLIKTNKMTYLKVHFLLSLANVVSFTLIMDWDY